MPGSVRAERIERGEPPASAEPSREPPFASPRARFVARVLSIPAAAAAPLLPVVLILVVVEFCRGGGAAGLSRNVEVCLGETKGEIIGGGSGVSEAMAFVVGGFCIVSLQAWRT